MLKAYLRRARTGVSAFARAPLPRIAERLTDIASDVSLSLFGRSIEWRIARENDPHRQKRALVDGLLIAGLIVLIVVVL